MDNLQTNGDFEFGGTVCSVSAPKALVDCLWMTCCAQVCSMSEQVSLPLRRLQATKAVVM